jgi:hypothetical protein
VEAAAAAAAVSAPLVVAVTGGKGCGKSAAARLLANSLISSSSGGVVYMDLDPGQPELTAAVRVWCCLLNPLNISAAASGMHALFCWLYCVFDVSVMDAEHEHCSKFLVRAAASPALLCMQPVLLW